jgi:hypothetical protein
MNNNQQQQPKDSMPNDAISLRAENRARSTFPSKAFSMNKTRKRPRWLTTGQAGDLIGVHCDTVLRWIDIGVMRPGGVNIRLRSWQPGRWHKIRRSWLREFMRATGLDGANQQPEKPRKPTRQEQRATAAAERLRQRLGE